MFCFIRYYIIIQTYFLKCILKLLNYNFIRICQRAAYDFVEPAVDLCILLLEQ